MNERVEQFMIKKILRSCLLFAITVSSIIPSNLLIVSANADSKDSNLVEVTESKASTFYAESNNAQKAFDYNSGTRWTSSLSLDNVSKNKQWIQATLKDEVQIEKVEITWFTPWVNQYSIEVSANGINWNKLVVSSVINSGKEIDAEGAEGLKQIVTTDNFTDATAKYIRISMTDVDISKGSYLSVVDVSIYSKGNEEKQLKLEKPVLHNIGSYGGNTTDKMIDGITDNAGNRWTSDNLSMSKEAVLNSSIEFVFKEAVDLTKFEVDWFNTPITKYSISISSSDDAQFEKIIDAKDMPDPDKILGPDQLTHTTDIIKTEKKVKRLLLSFDDAIANGYLSICEVRAFGFLKDTQNPWEINLIGNDATASSSSVQSGGMEAEKAIDGNKATRWASSFNEQPSYLLIDLKKSTSFDQMKIYQEAAYAKSFNVEVSTDGKTFTRIYETNNGTTGENNIYFGKEMNAQYVKLNFTAYGSYTTYSIWEVELYKNGVDRMFEMVEKELSVPAKISTNFTLPNYILNMPIKWSSTSELLDIKNDGTVDVTIPKENKDIVITASLQYGNKVKTLDFNSVILSEDNRQVDYKIYPIPQNITYGDKNVEIDEIINVVLADDLKNNDILINRINEVFEENGYKLKYSQKIDDAKTNLLVGVNGDKSIADNYADQNKISKEVFRKKGYDKHIVSLDEKKNIVVLSENSESAYYGFATLDLMFESAQSDEFFGTHSKRMTAVLIEDFADMQYRGVIEGFYGWPWSLEDRLSFTEFAKRYKLNYYAYGPKSDPYHLSKWNLDYPTNATITEDERELGVMTQEDFKTLIESCNNSNVDFVWSVHPAMGDNKIDFNDPNSIKAGQEKIMKKYESMYKLGVRQFGLFVDDIDLGVAYRNRVHIADMVDEVQKSLYTKWGRALDDSNNGNAVRPLMFVPSHYFLTFGNAQENEAAIREFARVHEDVIITFTGSGCWSSVVENDAKIFAERAGRNPLFWWNYSTNDVMDDQLFTDKVDSYYAMNKDVKSLYGFVSNPMNEAELSKISLFGIADYAWNVQDFDSSRDYDVYFEIDFEDKELAQAYKNVAINLDKNGKSLNKEKALFDTLQKDLKNNGKVNKEDIDALKEYTLNLQESLKTIEQFKDSNNKQYQNLYDEMKPWLNKLTDMTKMVLDVCIYLEKPESVDSWDLYVKNLLQLDAFKTDDKYAFTSLELNVGNAQSSYLRNVVSPNEPLKNFLEGINNVLKAQNETTKEVKAHVTTNVDQYKDLPIEDENGEVSLHLDKIELEKDEFVGVAFNRILHMNLDMSDFENQGVQVEYSMNGKDWISENISKSDVKDFAYIRVLNSSNKKVSVSGTIFTKIEKVNATATTNMPQYESNSVDKVVDGNLKTKFWKGGNQSKNDEIVLNLNNQNNINDIGFYFDSANGNLTDVPLKALVQLSNDKQSWETVGEINVDDIKSIGNGVFYASIDNINKNSQYVRYLVDTPNTSQWFRMLEIAVNENIVKPQVTIDGIAAQAVNDGNKVTYVSLPQNKEMVYQVIENLNVDSITFLSASKLNGQLMANVKVYASRTNYPFNNEWINLGAITGQQTTFDVSNLYNIESITIENNADNVNIFEIMINGETYVDDVKLKTMVNSAFEKLIKLEEVDLTPYTTSSSKLYMQKIMEIKNRLSSYTNIEDVEQIIEEMDKCNTILIRKGEGIGLQELYNEASEIDEYYYTEESYKILSNTLDEAKRLLQNIDDTTQAEINTMINKLNQAMSNLEYRLADYSKVDEMISNIPKDLSKYTSDSVKVLTDTLSAVVRDLDITKQSAVDKMAFDLENAIKGLKLKSEAPVNPSKPSEKPGNIENGDKDEIKTGVQVNTGIYILGIIFAAGIYALILGKKKNRI